MFSQQGHCDYPLTDLGISQAETVGDNLSFISWKQVYSSDLPRAHNTTKLLLSRSTTDHNRPITLADSIREIAYGVREGLSRRLSAAEAKLEYAKRNNMNVEDVIDNAEPTENVKNRQKDFVVQVLRDYLREYSHTDEATDVFTKHTNGNRVLQPSNQPILCVSHGGYIKLFLKTYCNHVVEKSLGNCSVSIVTIEWPDVNEPLKFVCSTSADKVDLAPNHQA